MAKGPSIGETAPDFELESTAGTLSLSSALASGPVLLVFYPGDDTPVCTKQLCDYRDNVSVFADLGVQVLAVNTQSLGSHEKFGAKYDLPFPLLSDADRSVTRAYGAAGMFGMTKRALCLIGRDGRVLWQRTDLPIFRRTADELREVLAGLDLA